MYEAITDAKVLPSVGRITYVGWFFDQGWNFFAPFPRINYTSSKVKCISETGSTRYLDISSELEKLKRPFSDLIPTNNADYIIEYSMVEIAHSPDPAATAYCAKGDCRTLLEDLENSMRYKNLRRIAKEICISRLGKEALGDRVKIVLNNLEFFSINKSSNPKIYYDVLKLPTIDYEETI